MAQTKAKVEVTEPVTSVSILEAGAIVPIPAPQPASNSFMTASERSEMLEQLRTRGVTPDDSVTDMELVKLLQKSFVVEHEKNKDKTVDIMTARLNEYIKTEGCILKDRDFGFRLLNMNVPKIYLKLFRDSDAPLKDQDLWKKIRFSGIKPVHNLSEILSRKPKVTSEAK